jgi:hypothetical protein
VRLHGRGNVEFFSYGPNNEKVLINDRANPNAIKAWARASDTPPANPEITGFSLAGGSITIVWKNGGTLQSATAIAGPWTSTGDTDGSSTEAATGDAKFYRVTR